MPPALYRFPLALSLIAALSLSACAPQVASTPPPRPDDTSWAFEKSDVPVDPDYRFLRLPNGMRVILRHNATPKGTALVRMDVNAGSLDETDDEQGYAHFLEHMAFNGSTRVPEGQMVALLERNGLAFGADTNASTSFDRTVYKLDLPRADADLIDTALMLMRETASELTISPEAVGRERGVILSEMRDRNSFALRDFVDSVSFLYPGSRYAQRLPIGTPASIQNATAEGLTTFYRREYVPGHVTLAVIGDFDVNAAEAAIRRHFESWSAAPLEPQPDAGPVKTADKGRTGVYLDPALSERIVAMRNGPWLDEPDTVAQRRENLLRQIGYEIVNRRLQRLSRQAEPPFRAAGFGTGDVFETARSTRLIVDTVDGKWQPGLDAAAQVYRAALKSGFTDAEVAEPVANVRRALMDAAASADTRSNGALMQAALDLVDDRLVPATPQSALQRFESFASTIDPAAVLAALRREAITLKDPLLRFSGRTAPVGGAEAVRKAWNAAIRADIAGGTTAATGTFAYDSFGTPGTVQSDTRDARLGIREVQFANGVRLNLKRTDIAKDQIAVSLAIDGGDMLDTRANPTATEMVPYLDEGGLGKHSRDDLDTLLAGHTVGLGLSSSGSTFEAGAGTTPQDLELQLRLLAALVTDPGYRPEGEVQYRQAINTYFNRLRATPGSALGADIGGILSDNDPRFSLQSPDTYRALSYARLKADITDRLTHGAIEIGMVGDLDEDKAIAMVAATFGALPAREPQFRSHDDVPPRPFTTARNLRVIRHDGPADQALVQVIWPTRDDSDPLETLKLGLLERVMRIELTDTLREKLGKTYSPSASSALSRDWKGYGTFAITASIDGAEMAPTRAAIAETVKALRDAPVDADVLLRARAPMLESLANALKTNGGWLSLVDRAQTESDRIDRYLAAQTRLAALTPADVQAMAKRWLAPGGAVTVLVLPNGAAAPGQ
ncbi:M16 family metallopeptidase [Novosphingobium colocasiae]|uniref:M16 family metallopeptidase n=1 Tax=Novosphingobium colocasiae TaxID=1256513 RepID=UPI0035B2A996